MNKKDPSVMTVPAPSFSFPPDIPAMPAMEATAGRAAVVTANLPFEKVRHLLSDKPIWRPRRQGRSPRPVSVDPDGTIREMNGTPVPGIDKDRVLRGLADEAAGRMRSLKEVVSQRDRDGL